MKGGLMPKALVCGRGGSGKSTLVSLLAGRFAASSEVLVVDADESNLGLPGMLGLTEPGQTVMDWLGGKAAVREKLMAVLRGGGEDHALFDGTLTPRSIPDTCLSSNDRISLLRIGKIEHSMEGCACPMGFVARDFLNRLSADRDLWVLVDTEAGIEHFGRGVLEGVDVVLAVVDPSREAVALAEKASRLCREAGKPFLVALNKASGEERAALLGMLSAAGLEPSGSVAHSPAVACSNLSGTPILALESGDLPEGLEERVSALREAADA